MTKINLIEKRKKYIAQRMNKLKEMEASFNAQERKKRTRSLVSKAHLEDCNANTLLGAFLFLKEQELDTQQLDEWNCKGGIAFNKGKSKNLSP